MTREERHIAVLIRLLENMDVYDSVQPTEERKKAIKAAISALEQEPCEDAISRETIEDIKEEIYKERTNISFNLSEEKSKWVNSGIYDGLVWAEEIIDKHIEGR